ncbi:DeoR/GlpR family DNA-binding transcription regulator [Halovulum sp. GXIMD14793]
MKFDRITAIRQVLFARGHMSIAELAAAVDASEPTIRRDLTVLERDGTIERTHGGAQISGNSDIEIAFESREQINLDVKRAIGERAYDMLNPGSSVFLDAGTTVLQLARLIRLRPMALRIFTNCLPVAQHLMQVPDVSVTLLGGALRVQNASMVGPLAEQALQSLWFDQVFLGVGAVGPDLAIYSADEQEARINKLMLERTNAPIILADSDKFNTRLTYQVGPLVGQMAIVSDTSLAHDFARKLNETGIALVQVDRPDD